jgi:hypothetical protein
MKRELSIVNKFIARRQISKDLQNRILNYLSYIHNQKSNIDNSKEVLEVIGALPTNLQEDIKQEINMKYLKHLDLLRNFFSPKTVEKLVHLMDERMYLPNEAVFREDQREDHSLFLIVSG